jgi:MoxR-like ATPase
MTDNNQINWKDTINLLKNTEILSQKINRELAKCITGQKEILEQIMITLLANGHCLLIGVPGLGKTLIVKSIAKLFDLEFKRIQFTPDLMPADIIGTDILEEDKSTGSREIRFIKGPIFTNILLADEINRTPPKTQAALLEAMGELQVTAGGKTYRLSPPFFTLASQNPIEQEGTYPLPEAQLDRFLMSINLDYLPLQDEIEMVKKTTSTSKEEINMVVSAQEIMEIQTIVREIPVPDNVMSYAVKLAYSTRPGTALASPKVNLYVKYGAGSRASQSLILAAKARALLSGRLNASIEDIKAVAKPILRHRIALNFRANADGVNIENLLNEWIAADLT